MIPIEERQLYIYNSLSGTKEEFVPIHRNMVGIYVCGPTVYNNVHLGNCRTFISFDIIFRYLKHLGYNVRYVRNVTDAGHLENDADEGEDRIAKKARIEEIEPMEVVQKYTVDFHKTLTKFNTLPPSIEPTATGHIVEQIELVKQILDAGFAYEQEGSVYFDVFKFNESSTYGKLSGRKLEDMIHNTRETSGQSEKRNPQDFALWKKAQPEHIMRWPSNWGDGFPGWHLECSAMSKKFLGNEFDIHGGGIDLIFPHHENETAQSICANNKNSLANYWMHNGFVNIEGQKMSKSLGNYLTVEDLRKKNIDGAVIRFVLLSTHYRQPLDWTNRKVTEAQNIINKWSNITNNRDLNINGIPTNKILEALCDDLNIPLAITEMHNLLKEEDYDGFANSFFFLGFNSNNSIKSKNNLDKQSINEMINLLIVERQIARKNKDYRKSDLIRIKLEKAGVTINDHGNETTWSLKPNFNPSSLLTEN